MRTLQRGLRVCACGGNGVQGWAGMIWILWGLTAVSTVLSTFFSLSAALSGSDCGSLFWISWGAQGAEEKPDRSLGMEL